jgi:hypothetical protein
MRENGWAAVTTVTGAVDLLQLPLSPDFEILTALIL